MIYPPRRGFAEFRSLDRALRTWGGGIPLSSRDFRAMRLETRAEIGHFDSALVLRRFPSMALPGSPGSLRRSVEPSSGRRASASA